MRLTFVVFDAYPLLDEEVRGGIGGAEVRAVTFATGVKQLGYDVEFVVRAAPYIKPDAADFRIITYQKPSLGVAARLVRSVAKTISKLPTEEKFFRELDTDVMLCFGVRNDTASIIRSAKQTGKKTILFLTSDRNIEDALRHGRHDRGAYGERGHLVRYALRNADRVVAQTPFQRDTLTQSLGIVAAVVRNPIDLRLQPPARDSLLPSALWVGRADNFSKRADICVTLARACPETQFRMIMNRHDDELFSTLCGSAPPNVEVIERVRFSEIERHFAASTILINTSSAEGFPNSFLQAAKYGKPIVSLKVDPGGMLSQFGCGACARGDLDAMAKLVREYQRNIDMYRQASRHAMRYVRRYHEVGERCRELNQLIEEVVTRASQRAA